MEASTLAEGIQSLRANKPDWVILDLMLPDGNGVKLLEIVRTEKLDSKVVVTTGMHESELGRVNDLHPDLIIIKPCDFSVLWQGMRKSVNL